MASCLPRLLAFLPYDHSTWRKRRVASRWAKCRSIDDRRPAFRAGNLLCRWDRSGTRLAQRALLPRHAMPIWLVVILNQPMDPGTYQSVPASQIGWVDAPGCSLQVWTKGSAAVPDPNCRWVSVSVSAGVSDVDVLPLLEVARVSVSGVCMSLLQLAAVQQAQSSGSDPKQGRTSVIGPVLTVLSAR